MRAATLRSGRPGPAKEIDFRRQEGIMKYTTASATVFLPGGRTAQIVPAEF